MITKLKGPVLGIGLFHVAYVASFFPLVSMSLKECRRLHATYLRHDAEVFLASWLADQANTGLDELDAHQKGPGDSHQWQL